LSKQAVLNTICVVFYEIKDKTVSLH